jgi:hypothetical protein
MRITAKCPVCGWRGEVTIDNPQCPKCFCCLVIEKISTKDK